jgi:hypothetical protein
MPIAITREKADLPKEDEERDDGSDEADKVRAFFFRVVMVFSPL